MRRAHHRASGYETGPEATQRTTAGATAGATGAMQPGATGPTGTTGTPGLPEQQAPYGEQYARGAPPDYGYAETEAPAGTFGGVFLVLAGLITFFSGLAAVLRSAYYPVLAGYAYGWTSYAWGWIVLALGVLMLAVGVCALLGMPWARWTGVGLAILTTIAGFMFLPYTPIWGLIVIALSVIAIASLARERPTARARI
jgi:hypothetical protein